MWNGASCEYCNGKRCTVCRKKILTNADKEKLRRRNGAGV